MVGSGAPTMYSIISSSHEKGDIMSDIPKPPQEEILELKKRINELELENSKLKEENIALKSKKPYQGGTRID